MAVVRRKCVIVGDAEVGKTELLTTFKNNEYPEMYLPIWENYVVDIDVRGIPCELALIGTSGQEDYCRLRPHSYPDTDVIIMCFSIVDPNSFENVREKWYPEVTHFCPKTPIVLVGTHFELREDKETLERLKREHQTPISYRQGLRLQKKMGAVKYVECSIRNLENVKEVFNDAALAAVKGHKPFASTCSICKKTIKASCQEAILCEGACDTLIHRKCALLSKSEFKNISSTDEPFCCPRCRNSMKQQDTEAPQPSKKEADETSQPSTKEATETPQPSSNNHIVKFVRSFLKTYTATSKQSPQIEAAKPLHDTTSTAGVSKTVPLANIRKKSTTSSAISFPEHSLGGQDVMDDKPLSTTASHSTSPPHCEATEQLSERQPVLGDKTMTASASPSASPSHYEPTEQASGQQDVLENKPASTPITKRLAASTHPDILDTKPDLATLHCLKYKDAKGKTQRLHIVETIAGKWKLVGIHLKFPAWSLDNIELTCHHDVETCATKLLTRWLKGHAQEDSQAPITWKTFLEALRDAGLGQLADNLTDLLTSHED